MVELLQQCPSVWLSYFSNVQFTPRNYSLIKQCQMDTVSTCFNSMWVFFVQKIKSSLRIRSFVVICVQVVKYNLTTVCKQLGTGVEFFCNNFPSPEKMTLPEQSILICFANYYVTVKDRLMTIYCASLPVSNVYLISITKCTL